MTIITGTPAAETLNGTNGGDQLRGLGGADTLNGNGGFDFADYSADQAAGATVGVAINMATGQNFDSFGSIDIYNSIEGVMGTNFVDFITGDANNNTFYGYGGADVINGGLGKDTVSYGNDVGHGGGGGIVVDLQAGTITDGFGATDTVSGIESVQGTQFADTFTGSARSEDFSSYDGADTFHLNGGFDFAIVGKGASVVDGVDPRGDQTTGDQQYVSYNWSVTPFSAGVTVDLRAGTATKYVGGTAVTDTLIDIERVRGTSFADTFFGSNTANLRQERFQGLAGDDVINGGAGYDVVSYTADRGQGGTAGVTVNLATGTATDGFGDHDTLTNIEVVHGTTYADTLTGDAGDNSFSGRGGADVISGGGGSDEIDLYFDDVIGGAGASINLATGTALGVDGAAITFSSIERVNGSYRNDVITGSAGADVLDGDLGSDTINAGAGDDIVSAYAGADILDGGAGIDTLSFAFDPMYPTQYGLDAPASSEPTQRTQNWTWTGVTVSLANTTAVGPDGSTVTYANFENLRGTRLADHLTGDANNNVFVTYGGADVVDGAGGVDTISFAPRYGYGGLYVPGALGYAPSGVTVNLGAGTANDGLGAITLLNIENVVGSLGADAITGDANANNLAGGAGADTMFGGAGDDVMSGDAGSDALYGDAGNDQISGGDGSDIIVGGVGGDIMLGGAGNDSIFAGDGFNYGYGGDGNDVLVGGKDFNVLVGENGDDYMYLYNAGGQAYGGAGNDVAVGNNANDVFVMGDGNDVAYGYGANDYFYMGAGADVMYGGAGVDVLLGEAGGDYFDGGAGIDYLFLGANDGAVDTVYMDRTSGIDVVNNFEAGRDVLRLVGTSFTGTADVLAATSDYGSLSIITIDANTAVWLIGVTPAQLAASSVALG